jgi:hypothetical protein
VPDERGQLGLRVDARRVNPRPDCWNEKSSTRPLATTAMSPASWSSFSWNIPCLSSMSTLSPSAVTSCASASLPPPLSKTSTSSLIRAILSVTIVISSGIFVDSVYNATLTKSASGFIAWKTTGQH